MATQPLAPVMLALNCTVLAAQLEMATASLSVCVLPAGMLSPVQLRAWPSMNGLVGPLASLGKGFSEYTQRSPAGAQSATARSRPRSPSW